MKRPSQERSLYTPDEHRKYVNGSERTALTRSLCSLPVSEQLFVKVFLWTGARISEVLALTPNSCQVDEAVIAVKTLKRRKFFVREIPVPRVFMRELDRCFHLRERQRNVSLASKPLWSFHRVTGWRLIKAALLRIGVIGVRATPRGLRHSFGVTAIGWGGHFARRITALTRALVDEYHRDLYGRERA
jgi:integrase